MTMTGLAERARENAEIETVVRHHVNRDGTCDLTLHVEIQCCGDAWIPVSPHNSAWCVLCGTEFRILP